ncbi:MAG: ROK family protein [Bacteroidota bacterium]
MSNMYCGVDIGGTKCSIALINDKGSILDKIYTCAHVDLEEKEMIRLLVTHIREILARNDLKETDLPGIGIGCAGHIRYRDGVIITTSNLRGFKNYPLREAIQAHFQIPVILDNDTNAQALGEHRFGAGKGFETMVFVTLSTGIGAGIIINNKLFRGVTGTAGEIGHSIVEPGSELTCTCGNKGCLMAHACGLALPHLFEKKLKEGKKSTLDLPPDFPLSRISGKELKLGLDLGDPVSMELISESGYYVGVGLYNLFQILNPPLFVLGGGLTNWGDFYLDKIKSTFFGLARDMIFDPIEISISQIAEDAGVIGAAALTLE